MIEDELAGPCSSYIVAMPGDRIALALGLTNRLLFDDKSWGAVAWIRGTAIDYPGIERITVADAFRLLGLQPPDTSTITTPSGDLTFGDWFTMLAGLVVAGAVWRRAGQKIPHCRP